VAAVAGAFASPDNGWTFRSNHTAESWVLPDADSKPHNGVKIMQIKNLSALRPTTLLAMYNDLNGVYVELKNESDVSDLVADMEKIKAEFESLGHEMIPIKFGTTAVNIA
jgi:hypothetical protein